jgi:hypothetical protein
VKNPKLYEDVMKVIGKVEAGKIIIPNMNVADVVMVKQELERMKNISDTNKKSETKQETRKFTKTDNKLYKQTSENEAKVLENSRFMDDIIAEMEGKTDISEPLKRLKSRILEEYDRIAKELGGEEKI